jgi:hypothetical protein
MRYEYRARAADCYRVASEITNPEHRKALLNMALAWMRLADQAERNSRSDLSYETPQPSEPQATQQQQQRAKDED